VVIPSYSVFFHPLYLSFSLPSVVIILHNPSAIRGSHPCISNPLYLPSVILILPSSIRPNGPYKFKSLHAPFHPSSVLRILPLSIRCSYDDGRTETDAERRFIEALHRPPKSAGVNAQPVIEVVFMLQYSIR
jgi:hypothetical protein